MKAEIDQSRCNGHARCHTFAPDVFPLDDDGYIALQGVIDVPSRLEEQARNGVMSCPEQALRLL